MVHYYRGQFFFPFSLSQETFRELLQKDGTQLLKPDSLFHACPNITPHSGETYDEYQYFHPHARSLLFDGRNLDRSTLAFEIDGAPIKDWGIEVTWAGNNVEKKSVFLTLEWVMAFLYDLDVGCLVIGVKYASESPVHSRSMPAISLDDVLDINNLLRRSAPSYLVPPKDFDAIPEKPEEKDKEVDDSWLTGKWAKKQKKDSQLAQSIRILDAHAKEIVSEDYAVRFDGFVDRNGGDGDSILCGNQYVGEHYGYWLRKLFSELDIGPSDCTKAGSEVFSPILDERNFACSFVCADPADTGVHEFRGGYQSAFQPVNQYGLLKEESERFRQCLYQYAFLDPSKECYSPNAIFRDHCLQESLYLRFRDYGSYYAFTRYSGVYLIHDSAYWKIDTKLSRDFNSMYFLMASLALCHRATLLALSKRASDIANVHSSVDFERPRINSDLENLRRDFLRFQNRFWFSEVTGQEMGIEIFNLWSRNMGNEKLFEEVQNEIQALHDFSNATVGRRLGVLTYLNLATLLLAMVGLVTSALGMSFATGWKLGGYLKLAFIAVIVGLAFTAIPVWKGSGIIDKVHKLVGLGLSRRSRK